MKSIYWELKDKLVVIKELSKPLIYKDKLVKYESSLNNTINNVEAILIRQLLWNRTQLEFNH